MVSMESIAAALESIDLKKSSLRKAYDDLQAHSYVQSPFTLQWSDLEEHLESVQKSIQQRFSELRMEVNQFNELKRKKEEEKHHLSVSDSVHESSSPSPKRNSPLKEAPKSSGDETETAVLHPQLRSLCLKMDGMGLLSFLVAKGRTLKPIRNELVEALSSASDPAKLVLDALYAFYPHTTKKGDSAPKTWPSRRGCFFLFEVLNDINVLLDPAVKEEAFNLAMRWKKISSNESRNEMEALGFLQLLATYDLASSFKSDELIKYAVDVAHRKDAVDLCRSLGLADKAPDLIRTLCDKERHLEAVKFSRAFDVLDKFPPQPILNAYLKNAKKVAQEVLKNGYPSLELQRQATAGERAAVRAVIKCIKEHNLESEYPLEILEKQLEDLPKHKACAQSASGNQHQTARDKFPKPETPLSQAQAPYHPVNLFSERESTYSSSSHLYGHMIDSHHPFPQEQHPLPHVHLSPIQESLYMNPSLTQQYGSSVPGTNLGVPGSGPPSHYGGGLGASTASYVSQQISARPNFYSYDQQHATSGGSGASTSNYGTQQGSARPTSYSYGQQPAASGSYDYFPLPL